MLEVERQTIAQIFRYLKELDQLRYPLVKNVCSQSGLIWLRDLPEHPCVERGCLGEKIFSSGSVATENGAADRDFFLKLRRPATTECPPPPSQIAEWIMPGWTDVKQEVAVYDVRPASSGIGPSATILFNNDPERISALVRWKMERESWLRTEAPARAALELFERTYEIRTQIEREGERVELVLGDGHLAVPSRGIQHPLLLRRVTLEFNADVPEFIFRPTSHPVELYEGVLLQIPELNGSQKTALAQELADNQYQPLGGDETDRFLRRMAQGLFAPRGEFLGFKEPDAKSPAASIWRSPVVFLRRRTLGFGIAVDRALQDLTSREALPQALLRIAGFGSVDDPEPLAAGAAEGEEDASILFSKEANEEQVRIVRRLRQNQCVVVQGPPGTGKTHTIANLLGHLLAEGKSVLVTAHTTKALRVLRDKVVPRLQPLCVSVLDNDKQSQDQLSNAVQEIAFRLSGSDVEKLLAEAKELQAQRKKLLEDRAAARHQLWEARISEIDDITCGDRHVRPVDAARTVRAGLWSDDWIPSPVTPGIALPLLPEECVNLYRTNGSVSAEDERELAEMLPDARQLPEPNLFADLVREHVLLCHQKDIRPDLWEGGENDKHLARLDDLLAKLKTAVDIVQDSDQWRLEALHAGMQGAEARAVWEDLIAQIQDTVKEANAAQRIIVSHAPDVVNSVSLAADIAAIAEICEHVAAKGSINFVAKLTKGTWRNVLSRCSIDGHPPVKLEDFEALRSILKLRQMREALCVRWHRQIAALHGPSVEELGTTPERTCVSFVAPILQSLDWHSKYWQPVLEELQSLGFNWNAYYNETPPELGGNGETERLRAALTGELLRIVKSRRDWLKLREIEKTFRKHGSYVRRFPAGRTASAVATAIEALDPENYAKAHGELSRLHGLVKDYTFRCAILKKMEPDAPAWAEAVRQRVGPHAKAKIPGDAAEAWAWRQMHDELERRSKLSLEQIQARIDELLTQVRTVTAEIIDRLAWAAQRKRVGKREQAALEGYVAVMKKVAKTGDGNWDAALTKAARENLAIARNAVPVWIMPLSRVYESFFQADGLRQFDVVIIDEASQSDVGALVALYLGKEVVVVGDEEQVTPAPFTELDKVRYLISSLLDGVPNKMLYDPESSVYHIATAFFGSRVILSEHFRCVPEIIQFSNDLSYNRKIKPLREPLSAAIKPAVISHRVAGTSEDGKVNFEEAEEIAALIAACIEMPEYAVNEAGEPSSFGVVSLAGEEQALLVESLLRQRISPAKFEKHRLLCGNAAQFQGDERDVMFLSVIDGPPAVTGPLPLESLGFRETVKKRFNVAASRARDQMWVVHSLNAETHLQPGDLRRRLIDHATDPAALMSLAEVQGSAAESAFERDVMERLIRRGYKVVPQWPVGSYHIDLVVEGRTARLAVECDGERWMSREEIAEDMQRQAVLERLGWKFMRIRGSVFFRNPEGAMKPVFDRLDHLGIAPVSAPKEGEAAEAALVPVEIGDDSAKLVEQVRLRAKQLRAEWADERGSQELSVVAIAQQGDADTHGSLFPSFQLITRG